MLESVTYAHEFHGHDVVALSFELAALSFWRESIHEIENGGLDLRSLFKNPKNQQK